MSSAQISGLKGTLQRENAAIGVFVTLENPTGSIKKEAIIAGFYHSPGWNQYYPRIQIYTIEQLLNSELVKMPSAFGTFKQAQTVQKQNEQLELEI